MDEEPRPLRSEGCCYEERGWCGILLRQFAAASSDLAGDGANRHEVPAAGTSGGTLKGATLGNEPPSLQEELRGCWQRVQLSLHPEHCVHSGLVEQAWRGEPRWWPCRGGECCWSEREVLRAPRQPSEAA